MKMLTKRAEKHSGANFIGLIFKSRSFGWVGGKGDDFYALKSVWTSETKTLHTNVCPFTRFTD